MASNPESFLISSILRQGDFQLAVAKGITSEMFHAFADEMKWIEKYFSKYRKTPTKAAFRRHFPEFIIKAVDDTPHFVDEVRQHHARQMMMGVLRDTADQIAAGDIDKAMSTMSKSAIQVATVMGNVTEIDIVKDWEIVYNEAIERKKLYDTQGMAGIPTGFETLDERTGGVQRGQSWIVGARLGEGKSWTLMLMAVTALMAGYKVHFSALEMSKVEVGMRLHNFLSGQVGKTVFQSLALAQGRDFEPKEYRAFLRSLKDNVNGKLTVSDSRRIGSLEIASQLERHQPDLYLLDYLTLAKTEGDGGWMDIGKFSKELKAMAGEFNVGIVSAAQLNRTNGLGKELPGAEAISQADAIGQDADAVITMKKRSTHITEYLLAKYRHGASGYSWYAKMDLLRGQMGEVTYNQALDQIERDENAMMDEKENATKKRSVKPVAKPSPVKKHRPRVK